MTRHGISHGAATLTTTIAAALLIDHARDHMPRLLSLLDLLANKIRDELALDLEVQTVTALLLASILAMLWGVAFAMLTCGGRR